jgi:hypothetical protein
LALIITSINSRKSFDDGGKAAIFPKFFTMKCLKALAVTITVLFAACGPTIYKSQNFDAALARHKTVAILPAEVTIKLRPDEAKKMSADQVEDLSRKTGYNVQDQMYGWFLRKSDKYHYTVTFQDVTRTNALLKQANIKYEDLKSTDRATLAKLLGADAVIQDNLRMEKPMSEGAAVAVGLLVGAWGSTNKVETTINIHDGQSGNLLWKYDWEADGSVGSSPNKLVDGLMRNASKRFPYKS